MTAWRNMTKEPQKMQVKEVKQRSRKKEAPSTPKLPDTSAKVDPKTTFASGSSSNEGETALNKMIRLKLLFVHKI